LTPIFGAAGTSIIDSNFKTRITRATDGNTYKNFTIETSDSALANLWNKDSSLLSICTTGGAQLILDLKTLKITSFSSSGAVTWSRVNRAVLYELKGLVLTKITFKKILGLWNYTSKKVIADFTLDLPQGFIPKWNSALLTSDNDDAFAFGVSEGIQDTGFYACSFRNGKKTVLNTNSGSKPFFIHEVYQTKDPDYVVISHTGSSTSVPNGPLIWDLNLNAVTSTNTTGHFALGTSTFTCAGPGGGQWASLQYDDPTKKVMVVLPANLPASLGQAFREDSHGSWNNAVLDTEPFYVSTGGVGYGQAMPYPTAWYNEILAYDPVKGIVNRICQTHNTCTSPYFIAQNAIAVVSQDGKKIAFTSDWMNTLGTDIFGKSRADVFIVNL
jgi:hypothetical protein